MTTFKEILETKDNKEFPDKIQAYDFCCNQFKDKFFNEQLQFNIVFIEGFLDIIILNKEWQQIEYTDTNIKYCGNCGTKFEFIGSKKE